MVPLIVASSVEGNVTAAALSTASLVLQTVSRVADVYVGEAAAVSITKAQGTYTRTHTYTDVSEGEPRPPPVNVDFYRPLTLVQICLSITQLFQHPT